MNKLRVIIFAFVCLLIQGCQNTPFTPVNVPRKLDLVPEFKVNEAENVKELEKLQSVAVYDDVIIPGDVFNIIVENQPKLNSHNVLVMRNGTISISPIGSVYIAGLTFEEANEMLKEKFSKYINNSNIVVVPVKIHDYTITLLGAVSHPGTYVLPRAITRITGAIALASGLARSHTGSQLSFELADLEHAYIVRDGRVLPVNFKEAIIKGNQLHNIPVLHNDYIYVPSLEDRRIAVLGEVYDQASFPYQPNLTLLQAIALASGLKDTNSRYIKLIRGGLDNPVVYNINIKDIQEGRYMDFALIPNDIVFVPKDGLSDWNVIMQHLLPTIQVINGLAGPFGNEGSLWFN